MTFKAKNFGGARAGLQRRSHHREPISIVFSKSQLGASRGAGISKQAIQVARPRAARRKGELCGGEKRRGRHPNMRMKLAWRGGRLKRNESLLIAAAAPRSLRAMR